MVMSIKWTLAVVLYPFLGDVASGELISVMRCWQGTREPIVRGWGFVSRVVKEKRLNQRWVVYSSTSNDAVLRRSSDWLGEGVLGVLYTHF